MNACFADRLTLQNSNVEGRHLHTCAWNMRLLVNKTSQRIVFGFVTVIVIELIAGVVEWLLMPASTCRLSLGSSAIVVVGFGIVMFGVTAAGIFWRRFVGRRIELQGQRSLESLRTRDPSRAVRVDRLTDRFSRVTRFVDSIWNHPWITALFGAGMFVVVFGALLLIGTALEANSCGL